PIPLATQAVLHGQDAFGIDSRIDVLETPETLDQQSRTGDEHDCESEFGNHKYATPATPRRALGWASAAVSEHIVETRARVLPRWDQPENNTGHNRNDRGPQEHKTIDSDLIDSRESIWREFHQQ